VRGLENIMAKQSDEISFALEIAKLISEPVTSFMARPIQIKGDIWT
jgi:hypothetical protein